MPLGVQVRCGCNVTICHFEAEALIIISVAGSDYASWCGMVTAIKWTRVLAATVLRAQAADGDTGQPSEHHETVAGSLAWPGLAWPHPDHVGPPPQVHKMCIFM